MLCDDLEEWDARCWGGRLTREEIYVYLYLIHIVVQQKLTQHCKAIILQSKLKKKKKDGQAILLQSVLTLPTPKL